ncbi:citrate lyase subunit beta/citryl-CoA lyase [Litorivivens lipolytica]|uniref:Citrate lyase subunit beta/citryl-CoA lyase n=1 Tax=Litorivivens lipolytica TaxID=1524264 RepID=A0A7W4W3S3_9GAMM|nr:CoA ester lyase [Litorivivens lipolytica]MBB3046916.1 citrate lyase subunit beta/citryl-CoA lyase [Litorivivens lipolytica]
MTLRPRRSVLYMPGSNARALEKARSLNADSLVLDLEDAVAPDQKAAAREQVLAAVNKGGYGDRELVVRVNGFDTPWGRDDIVAFANAPIAALCLPKVESAGEVNAVVQLLKQEGSNLKLWLMAETPRGVLNIDEICGADKRNEVIVMGTSDLAKELRVPHTPDRLGMQVSLQICMLAARAHGLDILDGVYLDIKDEAGYAAACEQGVVLGFDGKTLIHPSQIEPANRAFAPSAETVDRARRIIEAWEAAKAEKKAVAVVDGKLVEVLHFEEAKRHLAIHEAIQSRV